MTRIYVPADSAALALDADALSAAIVAEAGRLGTPVEIVRNGSHGMHWLEPLVEVQTATGRVGYGPVTVADVPGLFAAGWIEGGGHALRIGDPFALLEGMVICGLAVGARKGFIYIRSEYPRAIEVLEHALVIARAQGLLADCDIELRVGAGSYVCGEETALLESLEGKRGQVRAKPPLPAHKGLFGRPTVVNNVLTLATVPEILVRGAEAYAALG